MRRYTLIRFRRIFPAVGLIALVSFGGCKPKKYQVVTRIEPDGQFYRKLWVPLDDSLPPEALVKPKQYPPSTQPADYKLQPEWQKLWNDPQTTSAPAEAKEGDYVEASGHFATVDQIPRHYHLIAYPFDDRASTNRIKHSYEEYSLFGIDDWTETVTETVVLSEYIETVDKVIRKMVPVFEATLDEIFEREYDLRDFHPYLREQLAPAFRKFALWSYQHRPDCDDKASTPIALQRLKQILADIGFELPLNEADDAVDLNRSDAAAKSFFVNLFQKRIRSRSTGDYLTAEQAEALCRRLHLGSDAEEDKGDGSEEEAQEDDTPPSSSAPAEEGLEDKLDHVDEILARHFEKLHHTPLDEAALNWGAKMGGAHRQGPMALLDPASQLFDEREFNYELRTPGPILETNGELLGRQAVAWRFHPAEVWPRGYVMHASAIRWNREVEKRLFDRVVLHDLDAVLGIRESITGQETVRDALRKAIEEGSLKPLEALAASENAEERAAARAIVELGRDQ